MTIMRPHINYKQPKIGITQMLLIFNSKILILVAFNPAFEQGLVYVKIFCDFDICRVLYLYINREFLGMNN